MRSTGHDDNSTDDRRQTMILHGTGTSNRHSADSGQVEAPYTLFHCDRQFLAHDRLGRILGQLEVVDARHDAGQIVVCGQRRFVWLSNHGQRRVQPTEACTSVVRS